MKKLTKGLQLIAKERQKQIDKHGFTAKHHVNNPQYYQSNQLIYAANIISGFYRVDKIKKRGKTPMIMVPDNWDKEWFRNLTERPHKERLIIAGALIAAELDRLEELEKNK